MSDHFSFESVLAIKILRRLRHLVMSKTIRQVEDFGELHEVKVWFALNSLDNAVNELQHQISTLSKIETYIDAVVNIKFYIITWTTLSDVLAKFINVAFDLGIDEKDINLMMVFRNKHVKKTELPEILQRHKNKIRYDHFSKLRNDIVHRGTFDDFGLNAISNQISSLKLQRELLEEHPSEETLSKIKSDLKGYLLKKQTEYRSHLDATIIMLDQMVEQVSSILDKKCNT